MDRIRPKLRDIDVPLLLLHSGEDQLADPETSRLLAAEASHEDVTLEILDGQYHEVLNEPEKGKTIARVIDWLDSHA